MAVPLSTSCAVEPAATIYAYPDGDTNIRTPAGTGNEGPLSHQAAGNSEKDNVPQFPAAPATASLPYTTTITPSPEVTGSQPTVLVYIESPRPLPTIYADRNGNTNIETPAGSSGNGLAHQMHSDSEEANKPQFPAAPSGVKLPYTTTYGPTERATDDATVVVYISQGGQ
ncbi:hypothetical protein H072_1169 [Dactylellina haptotyla CBS 200.50]|uniref:Uncharacterized protein n=1 Tax=Dactylellina haptotyla (strain CBS 200.50) TaxID=1284197 RepID=S8BZL3_DACHA|nr:hypothetical protein H072_1169 [Dactylellina haptotyla CBS 200.50]